MKEFGEREIKNVAGYPCQILSEKIWRNRNKIVAGSKIAKLLADKCQLKQLKKLSANNMLMLLQLPLEQTAQTIGQQTIETAKFFAGNPQILAGGIVLIVLGILVLVFLKRIIVNSVLGFLVWAILEYAFGVKLPFLVSLIISVVFGLAGIGVLLVLRFFGII